MSKIKFLLSKYSFSLVFIFVLLLKGLETLLPYEHGDPLYYHLVGPKIWYQYSWNTMWKELVLFVHAGIFDLIFILPFFLTKSLLWVQLLGQALHFLFSIGLGSLYAYRKLSHRIWGPLAALTILTISRDGAFFLYAKNDGVLALLTLIAAYLVVERDYTKAKLIYLSILLGLIPSVKINGMMSVIPIALTFVSFNLFPLDQKNKRNWGNIALVTVLSLLVLLPSLWKNAHYIGNPFFPAFLHHFPGSMSAPMMKHYSSFYGNPVTLEIFLGQLQDFFLGKVIFILTPVLLVLNMLSPSKVRRQSNAYFLFALVIFALYIFFNGSLRQPRYFFSCYFLMAFFIFKTLKEMLAEEDWQKLTPKGKLYVLAALALVLCDSKLDKSFSHVKEMAHLHLHFSEKEIVRMKIPFSGFSDFISSKGGSERGTITYVLSDNLSDSYYLPDGVLLHTSILTPEAGFLVDCDGGNGGVEKLKKYSYAILWEKRDNACYQEIRNKGKFLSEIRGYKLYSI